jgi:hypothetical protein
MIKSIVEVIGMWKSNFYKNIFHSSFIVLLYKNFALHDEFCWWIEHKNVVCI